MKMRNKILVILGVCFAITCHAFAAQKTAQEPQNVYVADFLFDQQAAIQEDDSRHGPLEGLRPRIFKQIDRERSVDRAGDLVQLLSQSLVHELKKKGISASRVSASDELASKGILVQGEFLDLNEGDPLKQAAVGLNTGASKMQVKVMISQLPLDESRPDDELDLQSSTAQKGPGGILGIAICGNPYVLAAKFVMAKHDAEKDIRKLASEIASEIQKHLLKEQTM